MGCRIAKQQQSGLMIQCYNMLVLGYSSVGKTKLLSSLDGSYIQQSNTLKINTLILNKRIKLLTFQMSGKAQKTWKNFYFFCDVVLIVIDVNDQQGAERMREKLTEIDISIKDGARIFVVMNKVDMVGGVAGDGETTKENNQLSTSMTEFIETFAKTLNLSSLTHEVAYSHCSAQTGYGVKQLAKKLYEFIFLSSKIKRTK